MFFRKLWLVLFHPQKFFSTYKNETIGSGTAYFAMLSVFYVLLLVTARTMFEESLLSLLSGMFRFSISSSLIYIPLMMVLVFIHLAGLFILAWLYHICVLIAKGKHDYAKTFNVVVYSNTPVLLFAWIPYLSFAVFLYNLYIFVVGISVWHKISKARAVLVYFGPVILAAMASILFVLFFLTLGYTVLKTKFPGF